MSGATDPWKPFHDLAAKWDATAARNQRNGQSLVDQGDEYGNEGLAIAEALGDCVVDLRALLADYETATPAEPRPAPAMIEVSGSVVRVIGPAPELAAAMAETRSRAAGQAVREAFLTWQALPPSEMPAEPWDQLPSWLRKKWESIAQAAINAQQPQPAPELAAAMAETRGYRERLDAIRKLCEARLRVVGMVDGKGVARKVIAIIDKPQP